MLAYIKHIGRTPTATLQRSDTKDHRHQEQSVKSFVSQVAVGFLLVLIWISNCGEAGPSALDPVPGPGGGGPGFNPKAFDNKKSGEDDVGRLRGDLQIVLLRHMT
uniref:Uncharacterized protein n=1 Tax=Knipowitschia caucasica TaxID=637954 RepID=A0AAV2J5Z6_KNICA